MAYPTGLLKLPSEMITHIGKNLEHELAALVALASVNKHLRAILLSTIFRNVQIHLRHSDAPHKLVPFAEFLNLPASGGICKSVRTLTFQGVLVQNELPHANVPHILDIMPLLDTKLLTLTYSSVVPRSGRNWGTKKKYQLAELRLQHLDQYRGHADGVLKNMRIFERIGTLRLEHISSLGQTVARTGGLAAVVLPTGYSTQVTVLQCRDVDHYVLEFFAGVCPVGALQELHVDCRSMNDVRALGRALGMHAATLRFLNVDLAELAEFRDADTSMCLPPELVLVLIAEAPTDPTTIPTALVLGQNIGLQTLHIAIRLSSDVHTHINRNTWRALAGIVRTAPANLTDLVVEFVLDDALNWAEAALDWKTFSAAMGELHELQNVTFVNRKDEKFDDADEQLIRGHFRARNRREVIIFQRGPLVRRRPQ